MPDSPATIEARLRTARAAGAIALISLEGPPGELDRLLASLSAGAISPLEPGALSLRAIAALDEAIVARPRRDLLWLMPHGGVLVVDRIAERLESLGVRWCADLGDAMRAYPEASDRLEAAMLEALATATSPRAIPLLLDQPRRWRERHALGAEAPAFSGLDEDRWQRLDRLLVPPRVCVVGPRNAGKSTLTNTLAGRGVSIVSPIAGTTRDFVGVPVELEGLLVEWLDLPGFAAPGESVDDPVERAAVDIARSEAMRADLLVLLAAPDQSWAAAPDGLAAATAQVRVMSKCDLAEAASSPRAAEADLAISAATEAGIVELVALVRNTLLPPEDLSHPGPWRWRGMAAREIESIA